MSKFTTRPVVMGTNGVVTSGHYLASAAGFRIMGQGGNNSQNGKYQHTTSQIGNGLIFSLIDNIFIDNVNESFSMSSFLF